MVVLILLPLFLLLLKGIFYRSSRIVSRIDSVIKKMFFNCYIRFGLEAYLELCLSSLIRFKNYNIDTGNERFHSIFATLIFIGVFAYLAFSLFGLQYKFGKLNGKEARASYGDLYLGLRTKERTAIL